MHREKMNSINWLQNVGQAGRAGRCASRQAMSPVHKFRRGRATRSTWFAKPTKDRTGWVPRGNQMYRKLVVAVVFAAFALASPAEAGSRKKVDPRIHVVAVGVGAAATATYFAINDWKWTWGNASSLSQGGAIALTTVGCAALSPIVATAVVKRPLKYREAHVLVGSCVVPIIGGWLVNRAYDAHWITAPDEKPARKKRYARKKT